MIIRYNVYILYIILLLGKVVTIYCWAVKSTDGTIHDKNQSEAMAVILFFPIGPKNTNLTEDVEILLPLKFRWISFSGFREVQNVNVYAGRMDERRKTRYDNRLLELKRCV